MVKRKIKINPKAKREIDRYPLVAVYWLDICSDSSWQSMEGCKKAKLPICVTKGHLLTQTKGVTRIFGDYSLADEATGKIEEIGNSTIIPNSVIVEIKKIVDKG
tara:strand:+ start:157 stop:468 length:312 start_codon:yes stop_codon:yes gene_type:complete